MRIMKKAKSLHRRNGYCHRKPVLSVSNGQRSFGCFVREYKAALAANKGITVSSTLKVPFPCSVGDMDFCIILSNALDNAIHACEKTWYGRKKVYPHIK